MERRLAAILAADVVGYARLIRVDEDWARQAMRLDPYDAVGRAHLLGRALYNARSYEDAIEAFKQVRVPSFSHHAEIAACYAQLGSDEKDRGRLWRRLDRRTLE